MKTQDTNFNPKTMSDHEVTHLSKYNPDRKRKMKDKSSSEHLEEKPFLTEEDLKQMSKGGDSLRETINTLHRKQISSLESELKEAKKSVQLLHEDMINAEKRGQEKAESEIKALREERDKERDRIKTYLMEFIEERKQLCKTVSEDAPAAWKSFRLVADAVETELDFLQSVIHAIEPYPETTKPIP